MTADVPVAPADVPLRGSGAAVSSGFVLPSYGRPRGVHPPLDYSGYRWDIVLRGREATVFESGEHT